MNFLKTIGNSIHSPQFYATVLTRPFKQSLGYFFLLILLLSAIHIINLTRPLLMETPKLIQTLGTELTSCFPKDLEIKINNGKVSINADEPYLISCEGAGNQNLAVIDTKTPFSANQFAEYKVAAWVTKDAIVYKKNDIETTVYSLSQIKDLQLNRQVLNSYFQLISPYLKFIGPILLILSFFAIYLFYSLRLIHLLMIAALILGLGKIWKKDVSFRQGYQLGLHAITLGLVVDLVISLTSKWTHIAGFPFMVTILTLAVVLVNFFLPKKAA